MNHSTNPMDMSRELEPELLVRRTHGWGGGSMGWLIGFVISSVILSVCVLREREGKVLQDEGSLPKYKNGHQERCPSNKLTRIGVLSIHRC